MKSGNWRLKEYQPVGSEDRWITRSRSERRTQKGATRGECVVARGEGEEEIGSR
jgi:hypothetical protein